MNTIYLDIETIPLPVEEREAFRPTMKTVKFGNLKDPVKRVAKVAEAEKAWEAGGDCALDSMQCEIALIGYAVNDGPFECLSLTESDECTMLREWWQVALLADEIVAHNMRFDASKLVQRSWLQGVPVPRKLSEDLMAYRPKIWRDTMLEWACGDRQAKYTSLKKLCDAFGVTVKDSPVDGSLFYQHFDAQPDEAIAYNEQDVLALQQLWRKMGNVPEEHPRKI